MPRLVAPPFLEFWHGYDCHNKFRFCLMLGNESISYLDHLQIHS